jgi:hypothetical protein
MSVTLMVKWREMVKGETREIMPMTGQKLQNIEKQETAILVNQCLSAGVS